MSPLTIIVVDRPLIQIGCTLGEGPLFDPEANTLHFVDIVEKKVFHLHLPTQAISVEQFDEAVTSLALRKNREGLACTTAQGFAILPGDSTIQYLCMPLPGDHGEHIRFNDGACDSQGRYFAGTVYNKERGIPGQLWRFDPATNQAFVVDEGPFTDSNGLGWSIDGTTLYFTDSLENIIYQYNCHEDGSLSNRTVFVDALAKGYPAGTFCDGLCIDSEGGIWSARWKGSKIVRFSPDGEPDAEIIIPSALRVTSCCFAGDKMYVTTAHCSAMGGDASQQADYPDSGALFVVDLAGKYTGGEYRHDFAG